MPATVEVDSTTLAAAEPGATLVIRPVRVFSTDDLREIWRYRSLWWTLGMRDVQVRYKQAALGVAWAALQPFTQVLLFTVLFNRFAGINSGSSVPYPVFCFAGLNVWMLFSGGLNYASESLVQSSDLVTKVYFPRIIMPLAAVVTAIVDFAIGFVMLLCMMLVYRVPLHASLLLALPIASLAALAAGSVGLWTSAINIQFRDVRYALPFFFQLLVYLTPVFYPSTIVPERFRPFLLLNPMVAVTESFRAAMFGTAMPISHLAIAVLEVLVIGGLGFVAFRRMEQTFADRV